MNQKLYQIGEVSNQSGVSVRMLRHYHKLKLLVPSGRSAAGYRLYSEKDFLRLQQILIGRELGLSLEGVRKLMDDPNLDQRGLLVQQRNELVKQAQITAEMIKSVDAAISLLDRQDREDKPMDPSRLFDGFESDKYAEEVKERWGQTNAYKESARRLQGYDEADKQAIREETEAIMTSLADLLDSGASPEDEAVMEVAERHRLSIDQWFYPCSFAMHSALADMYETDQRFKENIDKYGDGLTSFFSSAIRANAHRKMKKREDR